MAFSPSPYQQAIFSFVSEGTESGIIVAVAGSGKTTTIVESLKFISKDLHVLFLAFNKSIAEELKKRVPSNVKAATFHSVCYGALASFLGKRLQVDTGKTRNICREEIGEKELKLYFSFINRLVGLGKSMGIGYLIPNDNRSWADLADHFDIVLDSQDAHEERGYDLCKMVLQKSIEQAEKSAIVDFDDMLYLSLIWNVKFAQYDFVFVDESQDTNQVQVSLLKRMIKPGGRLIAVGDPHQAIYGFRGADSEAMGRIKEEFDCQELPLSVSYRCPQAVVRAAQEFVEGIETFDGAPEGKVENLSKFPPLEDFTNRDTILCRNTAPLVETAFHLIRNKKPCKILGRDIGVGLENLIKKMRAKDVDGLIDKLMAYQNREIAQHVSKGREDKAQAVGDKVETLMVLIDNLDEDNRTIEGLVASIQNLFTDNGKGMLTLSTIHKAKGLEWPKVYILGRHDFMPSKWARKAWQKQQEYNLIYVAYTRSQQELYFLPIPGKKSSKG